MLKEYKVYVVNYLKGMSGMQKLGTMNKLACTYESLAPWEINRLTHSILPVLAALCIGVSPI